MKIIQPINKNALLLATLSFSINTILLLVFLITRSQMVQLVWLFYLIIAATLNTIVFIDMVSNSFINIQYTKENRVAILLFLINIPITILYIAVILMYNPIH